MNWCSLRCRLLSLIDQSSGPGACWPFKGNTSRTGMPYGSLMVDGRVELAHRVAYEVLKGASVGPDEFVLHSCDNPRCCNPAHLKPGSHIDNMTDMKSKGRAKSGGSAGEDHGHAKLCEADVRLILATNGQRDGAGLARKFGVSTPTISLIRSGRTWKRLGS